MIFDHPSFDELLTKFIEKCELFKIIVPNYLEEIFEKLKIQHKFKFEELKLVKRDSKVKEYIP